MAPELTAAQVRLLVEEQRPYFAQRPIKAFDEAAWQRLQVFVKERLWENEMPINVFRVAGTRHPDYQGLTWEEFLHRGKRMDLNLRLLEENPGYYRSPDKKLPAMSYLQVDGGDYYVDADGNHRTCLAKMLFHFTGGALLPGVEVNRYRLDHDAIALDLALRARGYAVRPLSRKVGREDNPGWMLETFEVDFEVKLGGRWRLLSQAAAREVLDRGSGWWSRLKQQFGNMATRCQLRPQS